MSGDKPFKGEIYNWSKMYFDKEEVERKYGEATGLGYIITGTPRSHPSFTDWLRTSWVVYHNEQTGEIETRNSRYQLVGEEVKNE